MTETLHIKTYFSSTVQAAFDLARKELGTEALLLNSRPSPIEARHLGRYEVVFATHSAISKEKSPAAQRDMAAMRSGILPLKTEARDRSILPEFTLLHQELEINGVDPDLARDLVSAASMETARRMGSLDRNALRCAVHLEMKSRLPVNSTLSPVVALVGPPGRGKTTTLVKLAISQGLARGISVRILTADQTRIAATEGLQIYAGILGVRFEAVPTVESLRQHLSSPHDGLTLIDTAGYGSREMDGAIGLASCLRSHPSIDVHLVLRADAQPHELTRAINRFSIFAPSRLIFTGLDEIQSAGAVYTAAVHCGLPLSYLSSGQAIPEDIAPADAAAIVALTLSQSEVAPRAAA